MSKTTGGTTTHYLYNGQDILAEYSLWSSPASRYTHGSNVDDPVLRTYLIINAADPRQLTWAARHVEAARPRQTTVLLTEGDIRTAADALPPGTTLFPAPTDHFTRFPNDSVPAHLSRTEVRLQLDPIAERALE